MVRVTILGISGTPIKGGNCDTMVLETLKAAAELGDVETDFVTLADKKVQMCDHCQWCMKNRAPCKVQDDFHPIMAKILEADGLILGTPAWTKVAAPPLPILFSRIRFYGFFTHTLRNKVFSTLSVGFFGAGMERTNDIIKTMVSGPLMIPVHEATVLASTRAFGQRAAYSEHGVLDDAYGMMQARQVGIRVVEVARMIKHANEAGVVLPEEFKATVTGGRQKARDVATRQ